MDRKEFLRGEVEKLVHAQNEPRLCPYDGLPCFTPNLGCYHLFQDGETMFEIPCPRIKAEILVPWEVNVFE